MSNEGSPIRILLVDDHTLVRQGLRMLLENHPDMKVVRDVATPEEALIAVEQDKPDVVLLDLDLGSANGLDLIPRLTGVKENLRIVILTGVRDTELHKRAVRLGAVGVVQKEQAGEMLTKAIRRVCEGEIWIDRKMTAAVFQELRRGEGPRQQNEEEVRIESLSSREMEVVALIAQGFGTSRIAETLFISEKTVRNHLATIYDKLDVSDRLELALFAVRHGLAGDSGRKP